MYSIADPLALLFKFFCCKIIVDIDVWFSMVIIFKSIVLQTQQMTKSKKLQDTVFRLQTQLNQVVQIRKELQYLIQIHPGLKLLDVLNKVSTMSMPLYPMQKMF